MENLARALSATLEKRLDHRFHGWAQIKSKVIRSSVVIPFSPEGGGEVARIHVRNWFPLLFIRAHL